MADIPSNESCSFRTGDGVELEAELSTPAEARAAALICHPHPLYGGNMYNNVVGALFSQWGQSQVATLRFNFRGSGASGGQHDEGGAERLDVSAAIAELSGRFPGLPLIVAGYSFGADVALAVAEPSVAAWLAVAPPLRVVAAEEMVAGSDQRPKLIVTGSNDDFRPPDQVRELTADWANTELTVADGANHFFMTGLDTVRQAASELLQTVTG